MKMLICDGMHQSGLELLQQAAGLEVDCPKQPSAEQVAEIIADYDALVVRSRTKVTAALIERAKKLKVIGRAGTGVDNIDIGAASSRGILVMNTPGANAMAAAEHTLAMMLALSRHIPQATQSLREGRWDKKQFMGTELYHQTLGVIGLGRIGSIVADRALGKCAADQLFQRHRRGGERCVPDGLCPVAIDRSRGQLRPFARRVELCRAGAERLVRPARVNRVPALGRGRGRAGRFASGL